MKVWPVSIASLQLAAAANAKDVTVRVNDHALYLDVWRPRSANQRCQRSSSRAGWEMLAPKAGTECARSSLV